MQKYLHKTPLWMQRMYPNFVWKINTDKKELFLTFDDGPIPEVTELILEELLVYQAKATFFCVGENLEQYPKIAVQIVEEGHTLGNHTVHHLKGWQTNNKLYHEDVLKCEEQIIQFQESQLLFRPPYGRIKRAQAAALSNYKIVMWNRLSWDFGKRLNTTKALEHLNNAPSGSIFVFHDNKKSFKNVSFLLPEVLKFYKEKGFEFKSLAAQ